jgi:hypothetical protein
VLGTHLADIGFLVEEEVRVILAGITFAGWDRDRMQVHAVNLRSLQDADVLEIGGGADDRLHDVAQHRVVGIDLVFARPAGDQLRLLVQGCVGDMRDIGQRFECGASFFLVPQVNRKKVDVAAAGQLGLSA